MTSWRDGKGRKQVERREKEEVRGTERVHGVKNERHGGREGGRDGGGKRQRS